MKNAWGQGGGGSFGWMLRDGINERVRFELRPERGVSRAGPAWQREESSK